MKIFSISLLKCFETCRPPTQSHVRSSGLWRSWKVFRTMLSSSAGSLGLLEQARLLCFPRTGFEDAFKNMVMVMDGVWSLEKEEKRF